MVHTKGQSISAKAGIGIIGAGNYTKMTMLPALKKADANLAIIASNTGVSGTFLAKKYGIPSSTTDYHELLKSPAVGLAIITTRHHLHAPMTLAALKAGKDVFVEKPLALSREELDSIAAAIKESGRHVMLGFNRRFSPFAVKMKSIIGNNPGPISVIATMNAGFIPPESWVHDLQQGGGRILGEACHFVDLISFLTGSEVDRVFMTAMGVHADQKTDVASIHLRYKNGSIGVINYFANGSKAYSKERVEVFFSGKNLILDNFRKLEGFGTRGFSGMKSGQDKGHQAMFGMVSALNKSGGIYPIDWQSIRNTHLACFAALESLKTGAPVMAAD
jgi:predicted dehydrogenase